MKDLLVLGGFGIIVFIIFANVFGGDDDIQRGMTSLEDGPSYEELPSEPPKKDIVDGITGSEPSDPAEMISDHFPLLDTIQTDNGLSKVYVTREFKVPELADLFSQTLKPREISEFDGNKQVLIYSDQFIILKKSEQKPDVVFIELANEQFVRNHYSPGFFNGLLTYAILNRMFNSNNWAERQQERCRSAGGCYGGYSMNGGYNAGKTGTFRGSSIRGGGPGAGK
ncbi:DUF4247 domain-containing protein [Thalassobacillus pellis]|uniref:DUF4247 domain-containing protein n=1 Tax=Thalassobacillus pellis TaxID=748008 RepID=UPI0019602F39|nr:DUF4247 domain-containing protein [Thalassobacillus pellis]MBM7554968.1 hypothetical protein [Thalassobacillus pellis]